MGMGSCWLIPSFRVLRLCDKHLASFIAGVLGERNLIWLG